MNEKSLMLYKNILYVPNVLEIKLLILNEVGTWLVKINGTNSETCTKQSENCTGHTKESSGP